jgi:predicted DCC family thiol-disulfide oxidoreductase YuxK
MSPLMTNTPTGILFNGTCPICTAEIALYTRKAQEQRAPLAFHDLCGWLLVAGAVSLRGLRELSSLAYDRVAAHLLYHLHLRRQRHPD